MKTDRLVAILVILLRKRRVQAKELADRFEVSVRTILRDVDAINLAGIPIVTYKGAGGGIAIADGYRLDKSVLTEDEMASIITALRGIDGAIKGKSHEILVEKLKNTLTSSQLEILNAKSGQLIIDLSPWQNDTITKDKLSLIRKAIDTSKELALIYVNLKNEKTSRKVEPYSLMLKAQNWYLYAWCHLRESFRFFKVSRIKEIDISGIAFAPREIPKDILPEEQKWTTPINMVALELLFKKEMENVILECFGEPIEETDDGGLLVRTMLPESNWLYGFLLSFGNEVEVVEPPHIRHILSEIAKGIFQRYSSDGDIDHDNNHM